MLDMLRRLQVLYAADDGGDGGGTLMTGDQQGEPGGDQQQQNNDPNPPANNPDEGKGSNTPGWLAGLPGDLRENETFKGFNTVGDLAKTYLEAQDKLNRAVTVKPPEEGASDEDVQAYREAMGIPQKAEDYELPDHDLVGKDFADAQRELYHKQGLSKEQAKHVYESTLNQIKEGADVLKAAKQEARKETETQLRKELGDKYQPTLEAAQQALKRFATKDDIEYLDKTGLGDDPGMIKLFASIQEKIADDSLIGGQAGVSGPSDELKKRFPNSPQMWR